ncbi:ATP-dependent helicase HepA [Litorivivens lipolytica]|uniref:RNA polymerase-associated protein RapA n=1 Tax=Litorivivens lipolytica TaxID=1524264 RepID=A0A7W4W767_9GAMM|nr:RNA polymerase-associated protein RapA [Litorivivens lipolytica]MBB3048712.1 ATP-dependent helicase HepA [Litorivivens lipolytica]
MSLQFANGQRWISMTEPDLGLGLITEAENRRITIQFPAAEEERTYAADNAPLSRVRFESGERIQLDEGPQLLVRDIEEHNQCLIYLAEDSEGTLHPVPEQLLSAQVQLHSARDRLLGGQLDDPRLYMLRARTLAFRNRARAAQSRGLLGARVDLIPHQFYIASQAAKRQHPRLLLADEVGLGKTIEAGLILHQLLLNERVGRVLILVPDSLIHQWLVEMRRRFNLAFSIFDEDRCADLDPSRSEDSSVFFDEEVEREREENPFETEQLVLASVDWLSADEKRQRQALEAGWDMLILDEAHHLHWQENGDCSDSYRFAEALCAQIPSVLLLTATPESAGVEGHFARLRLLDPARYATLEAFRDEQKAYEAISTLAEQLTSEPAAAAGNTELLDLLDDGLRQRFVDNPEQEMDAALEALLDRFGTGRSLFRNSRSAVGGFPVRELHEHPLPCPDTLVDAASNPLASMADASEDWPTLDPRVAWLEQFLLKRPDERALLICNSAETARTLEHFLRLRRGIASTVFHEDMSLFERDRAAAYFADHDSGAQLLVCSEIGSEGRNFQFAEHLVLFDLPLNPDLLEQRIGRLDRIGRQQNVRVHVPYFEGTAQARLLEWYRDAIGIFREPCTIGAPMVERYSEQLSAALADSAQMNALIEEARDYAAELYRELHSGRNRLLEYNSCRAGVADALVQTAAEEQHSEELADYLLQVADQFGLEHEDHSQQAIILRPGDHMLSEHFPHLSEEGLTGTFDRQRALSREDMAFLSWEHPLVRDAMELIVNGELGSASISTLSVKGLPAGSLLLEVFLNPVIPAPAALQLDRYLPGMSERLLMDGQGRQLGNKVSHDQLNTLCQTIKRKLIPPLMRQIREPLVSLLERAEGRSSDLQDDWRRQASEVYAQERQRERERLVALAARNPDVGEGELADFDAHTETGLAALNQLQLQMNALRLAIVS